MVMMSNTKTEQIITKNFINEATLAEIETPYGIAVNPNNGDIYLTDVGNYVSTGYVYCFDKEGKTKWKTEAGNIPAHFAFVY